MDKLAVGTTEAARLLGISRPTLYRLIGRTDFPSFRVGGRVLISVAGLLYCIYRLTMVGVGCCRTKRTTAPVLAHRDGLRNLEFARLPMIPHPMILHPARRGKRYISPIFSAEASRAQCP